MVEDSNIIIDYKFDVHKVNTELMNIMEGVHETTL